MRTYAEIEERIALMEEQRRRLSAEAKDLAGRGEDACLLAQEARGRGLIPFPYLEDAARLAGKAREKELMAVACLRVKDNLRWAIGDDVPPCETAW